MADGKVHKRVFFCCFVIILFFEIASGQALKLLIFPDHLSKTSMAGLKNNDSLIYYQCHVTEASTQLITKGGETISGGMKKITITDKFVVCRKNDVYTLKYFSTVISNFPNRKFSYLKVKEKEYWNFKLEKTVELHEQEVMLFAAIEKKGHPTNEFELVVDNSNHNALIIYNKKTMKHLAIEGNYLLKKNLQVLN